MRKTILIVEDDKRLAEMLALHLTTLDCEVSVVHDGESALKEALRTHYDLVILDRSLPGIDGLEVCRRLREHARSVPVLMVTALCEELDVVVGLETGADDYVAK